jgi:Four helix bundle sensory module for signal transduction
MKNVSIRTKLLIAFFALFLLIVAQGAFSINRLAVVNGLSTEMEVNWLPSTRHVGAISAEAARFRIAEARHILSVTDEDMNGAERDMEERLSKLKRIEAEYEPLATSDAERPATVPLPLGGLPAHQQGCCGVVAQEPEPGSDRYLPTRVARSFRIGHGGS